MAERSVLPKIKTHKKSKKVIQRANKAIEQIKHFNAGFSLTELNQLIYAAATVITDELGLKPRKTTNRKRKGPAWKLKLQKDIETKRKESSPNEKEVTERGKGNSETSKGRTTSGETKALLK